MYWRFNNVYIKPGNEQKTVFHTNYKLFKTLVIFFSITNSPTTIQTIINNIFLDLIVEDIIIFYLDNILIFTQTLKNYCKIVHKVLEVCQIKNMLRRGNKLQKNYKRHQMRHENIIYIQIVDNLGFSRYTVSLHAIVVIF